MRGFLSRAGSYTRLYILRARCHPWLTEAMPAFLGQLAEYARLVRLDRPIGTLLLLWPALWSLWIAGNGRPLNLDRITKRDA